MKISTPSHRLRIALYSHDTQGLGHIRRNLAIASAIVQAEPDADILLIAGAHIATAFTLPPRVDCLTLPALRKDAAGVYHPRSFSMSLEELTHLRAHTIQSALAAFSPHAFIVDKVPYGVFGELKPALRSLRGNGRTRCVLGLRDVLDDPVTTRREWERSRSDEAIRRYYDAVWIYGDPGVFDPVAEYGFGAEVAAKVRYTGYLNRRQGRVFEDAPPECNAAASLAFCQVGGGQDGYHLAHAFVNAELPADTCGVVVTGPFMPRSQRQQLQRVAAHRPRMEVREFLPDPERLLHRADRVVAMGGYNTICEILAHDKRALIAPRIQPRREQWIRAQCLEALGLLDVIHPDALTSERVTQWLATKAAPGPPVRSLVDLDGLTRTPRLLAELLADPGPALAGRTSVSHAASRPAPFGSIAQPFGLVR